MYFGYFKDFKSILVILGFLEVFVILEVLELFLSLGVSKVFKRFQDYFCFMSILVNFGSVGLVCFVFSGN